MSQDYTRASLELLLNISRELATTLDLQVVLRRVLFLSMSNVGAERASIIILDEQQRAVDAANVYGTDLQSLPVESLQDLIDKGLAGWVIRQREAALIMDTSQDERWRRRPDDAVIPGGAKSAICAPLMTRDRLVGVLTIVHPIPNFFNQDHLALVQTIADLAGIAIHNAQLYESLQTAHKRYYDLFEDSIDAILVSNLNGRILEANQQAAARLGQPASELVGLSVYDFHEVRSEKLNPGPEALEAGSIVSYESSLYGNESMLPVEVYVRKIRFSGEDCLQWLFHDISERKQLDELQDNLSAMIYHDLRSPLANIISSLDILSTLLPIEENPTYKSVFLIAMRSTDRMQRLINSLLDINRLEAGQPIANRKLTVVPELVQEAVEAVKPNCDSKRQTILVKTDLDLPSVFVDADMVRRVLINLLENASKYTPSDTNIEIGAQLEGEEILFWVQDNGEGIPPEAQEKIFDRFVRLQGERFPRGLGLGLAFCRLAVQAHGGKIWVESQEGRGSRFMFKLPAAKST